MLKVKKKIQNPKSKGHEELTNLQNNVKNSIKICLLKIKKIEKQ